MRVVKLTNRRTKVIKLKIADTIIQNENTPIEIASGKGK